MNDTELFEQELKYVLDNVDNDIDIAYDADKDYVDYSVNRRVALQVKAQLVSSGYFATFYDTWLSRLLSKNITIRVQV